MNCKMERLPQNQNWVQYFPLPECDLFVQFLCELFSIGDIGCRDVCLLIHLMELGGTCGAHSTEKTIVTTQQQFLS